MQNYNVSQFSFYSTNTVTFLSEPVFPQTANTMLLTSEKLFIHDFLQIYTHTHISCQHSIPFIHDNTWERVYESSQRCLS